VVCLAAATLFEMSFIYRFDDAYHVSAPDLLFVLFLFVFRRWGVFSVDVFCALSFPLGSGFE
jgi:hypothetical protein